MRQPCRWRHRDCRCRRRRSHAPFSGGGWRGGGYRGSATARISMAACTRVMTPGFPARPSKPARSSRWRACPCHPRWRGPCRNPARLSHARGCGADHDGDVTPISRTSLTRWRIPGRGRAQCIVVEVLPGLPRLVSTVCGDILWSPSLRRDKKQANGWLACFRSINLALYPRPVQRDEATDDNIFACAQIGIQ